MSTPVTRGELREDLSHLEQRFDGKLELWGGALLARIDALSVRMDEMAARSEAREQRMLAEIARHASAIQEAV